MSLKEIFCQEEAINLLQRSLATGKVAHAYIFTGKEGVGKFKLAKEWGKVLLCKKPVIEKGFQDSCGQCESCRLLESQSHPDFVHVYKELSEFTKDGKGKTTPVELPIDVIREFLIAKVSGRPVLSERKVFVVSEAEKLNDSSQNAFLKTLEEPPGYCCIILLCTQMEKLLATTKSRCQIVRFGPVEERIIVEKLKQMGIGKEQADYFARLSGGSIGQACQWAELELAEIGFYKMKKKLIDSIVKCDYSAALEIADWVLGQSKVISEGWSKLDISTSKTDIKRKAQKSLIKIVVSALYDAMKISVNSKGEIINFDQKKQIEILSKRLGAELLGQKVMDVSRLESWIDASVNEKLIFEQLLLNLLDSDIIRV